VGLDGYEIAKLIDDYNKPFLTTIPV